MNRYPHESRDELWFCLGFTITGPYAYDPIDKDTYREIQEKFNNDDDARSLSQRNGSHPWQLRDSHRKLVSASKAKAVFRKQITTPQPGNNGSRALLQEGDGAASSSRDPRQNTSMEEARRKNPNFRKRTVKTKEGQKDFHPTHIDPKTRRVHHGTQVRGAPKSVERNKHRSKTFPKTCFDLTISHLQCE